MRLAAPRSPDRRRDALARLLSEGGAGTQEELLVRLRKLGFPATQATLSRDLAHLGARRSTSPQGGVRYGLGPEDRRDGVEAVRRVVSAVSSNGALVVVRTQPGSAPAVARAIDLAGFDDVLGTIAGDDTIFVAPARERRTRALAARVKELFGV